MEKKYSVKKVLKWYWRTLPQYRWFYAALFGFYGAGILAAGVISPVFYKRIIDIITAGGAVDTDLLWQTVGIVGGIYLFYFLVFRVGDYVLAYIETNATRDLSRFTFEKLHHQSYEFFTQHSAGSLIAKSSRFVGAFEDILHDITFAFWFNGIQFLGMLVVLFILNPLLVLLLVIWTLILIPMTYPLLKKRWELDNQYSEIDSKVTERFADGITNALTVKTFTALPRERRAFQDITDKQAAIGWKSWMAYVKFAASQGGLITALQFGSIVLSLWLWLQGEITLGTVVLVLTYLLSIFDIIWNITNTLSRFMRHLSRASEMLDIFELIPVVRDTTEPQPFRVPEGRIEFQDLTFGYKEGKNIFENFSLTVNPGEKVALVGPSGAGKTTITKLLLRFFDPESGTICIDGQEIHEVRQDDLRKAIGYVPQEALLFHRPIVENIAYGKPGATREEVEIAARKAEAHEFIEHLPKSYDTLVGDRGVKLSGGERQRVAIARVILKNAPILILDEATSSLDSTSEVAIKKALDELMKGKTAIVIAHRLSTIQKMDRIVVLNRKGKIEEMGTHAELLAKGGLYAELWSHQAGGFIDEDSME